MSLAQPEAELASTPRWAGALFGRFLAGVIIWGIATVALSALALQVIPSLYPVAVPFAWLAVAGLVLALLSAEFSEGDSGIMDSISETVADQSRRENFVFLLTWLMIGVFSVSFEVALIAAASASVAEIYGLEFLALAIALLYPTIDSRLGHHVGWNVASTGGLLAVIVMQFLAVLYRVPPTVPRSAGSFARSSFVV